MGPPQRRQTVYFKRFGMFERVFGVERGDGRPAGRCGCTDARTDAGSAPDPPSTTITFSKETFGNVLQVVNKQKPMHVIQYNIILYNII